jgi:hypothetical protein
MAITRPRKSREVFPWISRFYSATARDYAHLSRAPT